MSSVARSRAGPESHAGFGSTKVPSAPGRGGLTRTPYQYRLLPCSVRQKTDLWFRYDCLLLSLGTYQLTLICIKIIRSAGAN